MIDLDTPIVERYETLESETGKADYIDRAEVSAKLTIPAVFTEETFTSSDDLTKNYAQSYGAKLCNNLTGKFVQTLFPANLSFFKLDSTPEAMLAVAGESTQQGVVVLNDDKALEAEKVIAQKERKIIKDIEKSDVVKHYYSAVRLAIIAGEGLVEDINGEHRVFNIKNYVVKRSPTGKVVDLIIKEAVSPEVLTEEQRSALGDDADKEELYLYTRIAFVDDKYERRQYIENEEVTENAVTYGKEFHSTPYNIVGWHLEQGEHYHRSFVELSAISDLQAFDDNQRAINEYNAIVSTIIGLVDPNGVTDIKDITDTPNGEFRIGRKEDVDFLTANKTQDMNVVVQTWLELKRTLAETFMMTSGAVRDSERTTAHEVQQLVQELEASFGGTYAVWAEDIQKPVVQKSMKRLNIDLEGDADLIITTGVQALGKSTELNKIYVMIDGYMRVAQLVGAETVKAEINVNKLLEDIAKNSGVVDKGYLLSTTEKGVNNSQAKQDALVENTLANATTEGGKAIGQNLGEQ